MTTTMTIISSQKYRDYEIVEAKKEMLEASNTEFVIIPVVNAHGKDFDDNDLYIIVDHHHTMTAAHELGIEIRFEEVEDTISYYQDIENDNMDGILEAHKMDSSYYYIDADCEDMIGSDVF